MATNDVNTVRWMALAYIWGRLDAGEQAGFSVEFANYYLATRQHEYTTLQGAYAKWVAEGRPVIEPDWENLTLKED